VHRAIRKLLHLLDQLLDFGGERHVEKRWLDRRRVDNDRETKLTARTITGKRRKVGFAGQTLLTLVSSPA
jgi:hypothetical protein